MLGPDSTGWSRGCVVAKRELSPALMRRGSLEIDETGIHLRESRGLVEARVVDLDSVFNSSRPNDCSCKYAWKRSL